MPTEWYFEDMNLHATIGPEWTTLHLDTVVAYAVYAYESSNVPGEPCWVWEAMMQDCVPAGPPENRESLYNKYADKTYLNRAPSSSFYNKMMTYDYLPGAWNLSENETLRLEWPSGMQMFKVHVGPGEVTNVSDQIVAKYSEPMESDNPSLSPGSVSINNIGRTITFTDPIDVWNWSRRQQEAAHSNLSDEWARLDLLPRGVPYIEFSPSSSDLNALSGCFEVSQCPARCSSGGIVLSEPSSQESLSKDLRGVASESSAGFAVSLPPTGCALAVRSEVRDERLFSLGIREAARSN